MALVLSTPDPPKCRICGKPMTLLDEDQQRWYCYKDDEIFLGTPPPKSAFSRTRLLSRALLPRIVAWTMGVAAVALTFVFPLELDNALRTDIFRTLAQVGGALIGFVAIVGVFALNSIQSRVSDISKQIGELQSEQREVDRTYMPETLPYAKTAIIVLELQIVRLRERREELRDYGRLGLILLFFSVISFIAEIWSAVLGMARLSVIASDWRWMLFYTFYSLFAGSYMIYLLAQQTTMIPYDKLS